jgi:hypothetical protein
MKDGAASVPQRRFCSMTILIRIWHRPYLQEGIEGLVAGIAFGPNWIVQDLNERGAKSSFPSIQDAKATLRGCFH